MLRRLLATLFARKEAQRRKESGWQSAIRLGFERLEDRSLLTVVDISTAAYGGHVEGGESFSLVVSRGTETTGDLTGNVSFYGTASSSDFETSLPSSVDIPDGESSAEIVFTPRRDNLREGTEHITCLLESGSGYTVGNGYSSASYIIDDPPVVSITGDDSVGEGSATARTFTVHRTGGDLSQALPVTVESTGSAVEGTDFTTALGASPLELVILANQTSASFDMEAIVDNLVEGSETAAFAIVADAARFLIDEEAASAGVSILDDPTILSIIGDESVGEGSASVRTFTVVRSGGNQAAALNVQLQSVGSASATDDFTSELGTAPFEIVILANESEASFSIETLCDNLIEGAEAAAFAIVADAARYTIDEEAAEAGVSILDNVPTLSLAATDALAVEDSATEPNTGHFVVERSGGDVTQSLSFTFTIVTYPAPEEAPYFATAGTDYTAPESYSITIPANETTWEFWVTAANDDLNEGNELVTLALSENTSYYAIAGSPEATVVIDDNDEWTVGIVALGDKLAREGGENGQFLIYRTGELDLTYAMTVSLEISQASTAGWGDHNYTFTTYEIPAGEAYVVIDVLAENDALAEGDETLIVSLLADDPYAIDATDGAATLTLVDNDAWTVDVLALVSHAIESEELPGEYLILRSGQTDFSHALTVNVAMATASTATSGDYEYVYGSYEIPAGASSVSVSLWPIEDSTPEDPETAVLEIQSGTGYAAGTSDSATVTIHDDLPDGWNIVSISAETGPASETGPLTKTFTITRIGPSDEPLTVGFYLSGTAINGIDYEDLSVPESDPVVFYATILANENSITVDVAPLADQVNEPSETVIAMLTNGLGESAVSQYAVSADREATITIDDSEGPLDDLFIMYMDLNDDQLYFNLLTPPSVFDNDPTTGTPFVVEGLGPEHGTVTFNSDGTFVYEVGAGWDGSDSFWYSCAEAPARISKVELFEGFKYQKVVGSNTGNHPSAKATPGLLLDGGDFTTDGAHARFVQYVNGGDIVVFRPGNLDDEGFYNFLSGLGDWDSIEVVSLDRNNIAAAKTAANDEDGKLLQLATNAEGDYFAGGGQEVYVEILPGTKVIGAINDRLAAKNVVLGGNSAGMAILAGYIYTAENGGVTSADALADPRNDEMTFREGFLCLPQYMSGVITDTHMQKMFATYPGGRDEDGRMGRSVAFLARMWADPFGSQKAICATSDATVFIEDGGSGEVFGAGWMYFLQAIQPHGTVEVEVPLSFATVLVFRLGNGMHFNLNTWNELPGNGNEQNYYWITSTDGVLTAYEAPEQERDGIY